MKNIFCPTLILFLLLSCNNTKRTNVSMKPKGISSIIIKDGSFIFIQMAIDVKSKSEIIASISYTNKSSDPLLFYKALLPIEGKLQENIFSIFKSTTLENLKYTGTKSTDYVKTAPDDDEGVIIPDLLVDKFVILYPEETIAFKIDLYDYYDFGKGNINSTFLIAPSGYLPAVSPDYKQVTEKDSLDGNYKPVYYDITLPKKISIDSMRIEFRFNK